MTQASKPDLPVDPERLRRRFPALTEEDIAAYIEVTRRILSERDAGRRAQLTRDTVAQGRRLRERRGVDQNLSAEESLALRYLDAIAKMQGGPATH